jgi:uncharacterized membrane protein
MWNQGFDGGMRYGFDPGFFFMAGLFKLAGFALFILALLWLFRTLRRASRFAYPMGRGGWQRGGFNNPNANWRQWMNPFSNDNALDEARNRLARSEITPEQFQDIKRGLAKAETRDPAVDIARGRLARGEISAEEFESIRRALES